MQNKTCTLWSIANGTVAAVASSESRIVVISSQKNYILSIDNQDDVCADANILVTFQNVAFPVYKRSLTLDRINNQKRQLA